MIRVRLQNRWGDVVHTDVMYPMNPMPEILLWGTRYFVRTGQNAGAVVYTEGLLYALPEPPTDPTVRTYAPTHTRGRAGRRQRRAPWLMDADELIVSLDRAELLAEARRAWPDVDEDEREAGEVELVLTGEQWAQMAELVDDVNGEAEDARDAGEPGGGA